MDETQLPMSDTEVRHRTIQEKNRVAFPPECLKAAGLKVGDDILVYAHEGKLIAVPANTRWIRK